MLNGSESRSSTGFLFLSSFLAVRTTVCWFCTVFIQFSFPIVASLVVFFLLLGEKPKNKIQMKSWDHFRFWIVNTRKPHLPPIPSIRPRFLRLVPCKSIRCCHECKVARSLGPIGTSLELQGTLYWRLMNASRQLSAHWSEFLQRSWPTLSQPAKNGKRMKVMKILFYVVVGSGEEEQVLVRALIILLLYAGYYGGKWEHFTLNWGH